MILGCYLPIFFMTRFPTQKAQFAMLNAACMGTLGFVSNMGNGILGDVLEKRDPAIKSKLCAWSAIISSAALAFSFVAPVGFYASFAAYALHVLVSAGYQSNAFTMIQNSVPAEEIGSAMSSYNLFTNLAQTVSPIIFGFLATAVNAKKFTGLYGPMIAAFLLAGYLPSAVYYFMSGNSYKRDFIEK